MKNLRLLFLFLFAQQFILAQQPSHFIIGEEELAGINIYSCIQDNNNSVWLTTNFGLFYYDGLRFTQRNNNVINDLSLFGLTKDNNEDIFCYNLSGQIFKITNGTLELFWQIPKELVSNVIYINFDQNNNLIISCKKLIQVKNNKYNVLYDFNDLNASKLVKINSKLLFFHNRKLFNLYNDRVKIVEDFNNITSFNERLKPHIFENGEIALFSNSNPAEAFYLNKNKIEEIKYSVPKETNSFYTEYISKKNNLVWLASSKNGIFCFDKKGKSLFKNRRLFKNYFISSYLDDNEGNIWLCTFGKGIIVIPKITVIDYSNSEKLNEDDLNKIIKVNKQLYFGGVKGNLYKLNDDEVEVSISNKRKIETLKYLPKSNLIFINNEIYDGTSLNFLGSNDFNKYDVFQNMKSDSIFYVTRQGLFYLNKNFSDKNLNYSVRSYAIYYDEKNYNLWIASSTGLKVKNKNSIKKITEGKQEIFSNQIIPINNNIWVASSTGIYIFNNLELVKKITTQKGLLSNNIIKLVQEGNYVYIASTEGIQRLNIFTNKLESFTKIDGLISNAIFDFEVLDEYCYVITSKGLQKFNFKNIETKRSFPKLIISEVLVNSYKNIFDNADLNANENNLEFTLSSITHKSKRNLKYKYFLEGYDKAWHETDFLNNKIKYTNLPAGNFELLVKLQDGKFTSKNIAHFKFAIDQVFWKKWQFVLLVTILTLGLFALVFWLRINVILKNKNREIETEKYIKELNKSQLIALKSQMNPHFIFNALNSIQEFIIHNKKELASNYLGDFADLMRSYLQHSQEELITLSDEIETLTLYLKLEQIRFDDEFDYEIKCLNLSDIDSIHIPSFLIQPFVENAIKHGLLHKKGKKNILIEFKLMNDDLLQCIIQDNGIGRKAHTELKSKSKHKSFATKASQMRLDLINQNTQNKIALEILDLTDSSNNSLGTKVIISIPI